MPPSNSACSMGAENAVGSNQWFRKPKTQHHRIFLQDAGHSIRIPTEYTTSCESEVSTTESEGDSENASVTEWNQISDFTDATDFVRRRAHSQGRMLRSKQPQMKPLYRMDTANVYGTVCARAATCLETKVPLTRNDGSRTLEDGGVFVGNFRNSTIVPRLRFSRSL
uniref:AlNc14C312G10500 protein n=1 Tax=Albugo laibachii Nc14 TaxID=890382 RepID=F0WW55_9STRA|nr:AlNc14C312G10500 [Albugo laibachii Nc14]|eukprot:CCA25674.1 AlNc14C312G10500 [Albugo laibachii Nc14]